MKLSRIFIVNLLLIAGMLTLSVWAWEQLPANAQIPTRFDFDGTPIAYMNKSIGLLLMPLVTSIVALNDLISPRIEPNQNNIQRSKKAYDIVSLTGVIFCAVVHLTIILSALGKAIDTTDIITVAMGVLTVVSGNYLSKIRHNYSFGFRTRWTLASNLAWHKTHRWASWLTVAHGLAFIVAGLSSSTAFLIITLISFATASLIILPIYSYLLWKSDSNHSTE